MAEAETLKPPTTSGDFRRLRLRRKVRGLSLQDVADRADVSIGLLSQIERGLTMPSVKSLSAICRALDMPVNWLFESSNQEDEPDTDIVVRHDRRRVLDLGSKGMRKELLTPDLSTDIQMMRLVIQPGGSTGDTPYNHSQGAKCGTVIAGTLGLEIDGRELRIEKGDSFAFKASSMIRFWAEGNEECRLIWVVSPAVY